jgi:hypothetical protein
MDESDLDHRQFKEDSYRHGAGDEWANLAFSISHEHSSVRFYSYNTVIDRPNTTFYWHTIKNLISPARTAKRNGRHTVP